MNTSYSIINGTVTTTVDPKQDGSMLSYQDDMFENIFLAIRNIQALVTIIVNLVTIVITCRYKRLQTSSNVLIVSLAVADFITGLSTPFGIVGNIIQR